MAKRKFCHFNNKYSDIPKKLLINIVFNLLENIILTSIIKKSCFFASINLFITVEPYNNLKMY